MAAHLGHAACQPLPKRDGAGHADAPSDIADLLGQVALLQFLPPPPGQVLLLHLQALGTFEITALNRNGSERF